MCMQSDTTHALLDSSERVRIRVGSSFVYTGMVFSFMVDHFSPVLR